MSPINIPALVATVLNQVKAELSLVVTDNVPEALAAVNKYVANLEIRAKALLEELAESNDAAFLVKRVKEEPSILETEVFSFIIIGKGIAQNLVNSIQNIILSAVQTVLPVGA